MRRGGLERARKENSEREDTLVGVDLKICPQILGLSSLRKVKFSFPFLICEPELMICF